MKTEKREQVLEHTALPRDMLLSNLPLPVAQGASHTLGKHSTTELHPQLSCVILKVMDSMVRQSENKDIL